MTRERASARRAALAFALSGPALGYGVQAPALAWVGVVATAYALSQPASRRVRVGGLLLAAVVAAVMRLTFLWNGFGVYLDPDAAHRWAFGVAVCSGLIDRAPVALVTAASPRSRAYVAAWIAPAWLVGERLWCAITGLPLDAWMLSQARTSPVLRVLAWCGYFPTATLALALAAAVGVTLAQTGRSPRARAMQLAAYAVIAAVACAVPKRRAGVEALRGVVALRFDRAVATLPPMPRARLVVWPETASRRPTEIADEGPVTDARVPLPMRGDSRATHVIGLLNRHGDVAHNAAMVVDADGAVRWMRAKSVLFPTYETPWFGVFLARGQAYTPGVIEPVTEVLRERTGVLICSELLDRAMVERATPAGVRRLLLLAGDGMVGSTWVSRELVVALATLAAVERGVAVVRSSWRGVAVLIAPDGTVVARSDSGHLRNASFE